jgi:hypothetical protein
MPNIRGSLRREIPSWIIIHQNETHSEVRKVLYSVCDENIGTLYEMITASDDPSEVKDQALFYAIEGAASRILVRADYLQESALLSILQIDAVPFELRKRPDSIVRTRIG